MTPQEFQTYLNHQRLQIQATQRIADALEQIIRLVEKTFPSAPAPDVVFELRDWVNFDWSSIDATVIQRDASGPTVVNWQGRHFFRRSPNNKFTAAIWFSRCTGKDDKGKSNYERLCTFKSLQHLEVDELPNKVVKHVSSRS